MRRTSDDGGSTDDRREVRDVRKANGRRGFRELLVEYLGGKYGEIRNKASR